VDGGVVADGERLADGVDLDADDVAGLEQRPPRLHRLVDAGQGSDAAPTMRRTTSGSGTPSRTDPECFTSTTDRGRDPGCRGDVLE